MRKTKLICTIGPASDSIEILKSLIEKGMNVARLNFSHGTYEEHGQRIANIRRAAQETGKNIGILLDIKGPEIRTHLVENEEVQLVKGDQLILAMDEVLGTSEKISVSYDSLIDDLTIGSTILLDDGLIALKVLALNLAEREIVTEILNSGRLSNYKGVNVPGVSVSLPSLTDKDRQDIIFGINNEVDFIAASFVRKASDLLEIREILESQVANHINIIAKIENEEGVSNLAAILQVADGVMVARGDLGVEIPAEEVPLVQKEIIKKCNYVGKPVITATQMLDSMERNPRPTRAEASDVANAILDGTDALMLSGETAVGNHPLEAVETMDLIAQRTEQSIDHNLILSKIVKVTADSITDTIGQSVARSVLNLPARAIITPTESGHTARMIAKYRPRVPIIAISKDERISRSLSLSWGVYPLSGLEANSTDEMLELAIAKSLMTPFVEHGDLVVITAGVPVGEAGTTNIMKIHIIGDTIGKGQGIGNKTATGKVVLANSYEEVKEKLKPNSILVTRSVTKEMTPLLQDCLAIVTREAGLTSPAAIIGLNLKIPVIVGLERATEILSDGMEITVDAKTGTIYEGHTNVL